MCWIADSSWLYNGWTRAAGAWATLRRRLEEVIAGPHLDHLELIKSSNDQARTSS